MSESFAVPAKIQKEPKNTVSISTHVVPLVPTDKKTLRYAFPLNAFLLPVWFQTILTLVTWFF